jgi:DNA polymerase-3 subunit gamma/tau
MEKFVVSARKYRPTVFTHVLGQSHITTTLKNAIRTNHLAHAFLFCGPRGVGKTTCARILAKAINCQQLTADIEPCNACESCKSFNQRTSFNIYELDAASNNSVEDVRSLVDQVRYPPQNGAYKIYIIDEVHMLSQAAFNAFLKTLEEPPSYAIFILATTEKHKVLPTILSRCQIFDFHRIKPQDIVQQLKNVAEQEQIAYDEEALHLISLKSDGALRDALSMFDVIVSFGAGTLTYEATLDNLHILDYSYYFRLTEAILQNDIKACLLIYDEIIQSGFDGIYFLEGLVAHFRSLLVAQDLQTLPLLEVPTSIQEKYGIQAQQASPSFLLEALQLANQCALQYKESLNKRFHVELALIELASKRSTDSSQNPIAPKPSAPISKIQPSIHPVPNSNVINPNSQPSKATTSKSEATVIKDNKKEELTPQVKEVMPQPLIGDDANNIKRATLQATIKIPQLSHIKANIVQPKAAEVQTSIASIAESSVELTKEMVLGHWQAYAQQLKLADRMPAYNLLNQPIELEDNTITIKFTNTVEEHILAAIKEELVNYLRNNLKHPAVDVKAVFTPNQSGPKRPYTAQERFQYLVNKNPQLQGLKEQLQLEVMD